MQPCKTGDQPYSDASPNGECSLERENKRERERAWEKEMRGELNDSQWHR